MEELTLEIADSPVFVRRGSSPVAASVRDPVLYLHSAPTSSDDWVELLAQTGGYAPDLPGFGRSGKGGHLDLGLGGQADFVLRLLDALGIDRVSVVAHGWGATAALLAAAAAPERVTRMVLLDAAVAPAGAPLPAIVRRLQRPALGELMMGSVNRRWLARILRRASADPAAAWPDAAVDAVWAQFDQGTQRAILRLARSADPALLAAARRAADELRAPALVLSGVDDPWCPAGWSEALAGELPDASRQLISGAGHWPWRERPEVTERIVRWLGGDFGR